MFLSSLFSWLFSWSVFLSLSSRNSYTGWLQISDVSPNHRPHFYNTLSGRSPPSWCYESRRMGSYANSKSQNNIAINILHIVPSLSLTTIPISHLTFPLSPHNPKKGTPSTQCILSSYSISLQISSAIEQEILVLENHGNLIYGQLSSFSIILMHTNIIFPLLV